MDREHHDRQTSLLQSGWIVFGSLGLYSVLALNYYGTPQSVWHVVFWAPAKKVGALAACVAR
jgi:hypothetical protein